MRESYKDIFTELLLDGDTRVGFHKQDSGLLVWQGAYLTRSAETLLSWRAVANALNDLIEQHELIAAIDPKKPPQVAEQLSFELPEGAPPSAEDNRLEKDDFLTPEKQETVIRSALPVAEYNAPQMDDGSVITDEEINLALAAGSNFENSKFRIHNVRVRSIRPCSFPLKWRYGLTKFPIGTSRPQTNVSASLHCFVLDSASWDIAPVSRLNMCVLWKSWIAINRNERRNVNARSRNRYFQVKKCSSHLKPRWINAHKSF